jgi:hypothetical protein
MRMARAIDTNTFDAGTKDRQHWCVAVPIAGAVDGADKQMNIRSVFAATRMVIAAAALITALPTHATRIWSEHGVATVVSGFDVKVKQFVHRKFYLVAVGPDEFPGAAHDVARTCTNRVVTKVGEDFRVALWKLEQPATAKSQTSLDKPEREKAAVARDSAIDGLVNRATQNFRTRISACSSGRVDAGQFHLGLVQRICDTRTNSCSNTANAFADNPAAIAFTKLSLWIDARDGKHPTLPANHPVLLPNVVDAKTTLQKLGATTSKEALEKCQKETEKLVPGTAKRPLTCLALEMASRPFKESNIWGDAPPAPVAQAELEALVVKAREAKTRIDRSVARIVDVPRETAVRFVDVLDEPQQALLDLKTDAAAKLLTIQDELARSRVIECARYKGLTDTAQISACTGYKIDAATLNQCLAGSKCVPTLGEKGWAGVLAQLETGSRKELAGASLMPRMKGQYQHFVETANTCAKFGSKSAAATCMLERRLGDKEKAAWACVRGKAASQLDAKTLECAVGNALPARVTATTDCIKKFKRSEDQAFCAAQTSLPPEAQHMMECQRQARGDSQRFATCMTAKLAGGDVGKAAVCLQQSGGDWAKGATCYAAGKLPPQAAQAISCVQKSGGGATQLAGCMAAQNVPENLRKPAQCLAESGGDPFGAGVCMASDGLNADQRIALQCLASTGGEPVTFATCAGGRLFVKEMFNCVDKKLFEGNCMGKGNELVKLATALGINLAPTTVVGQALNVPLDVIKFQVAFAQAALKGIEELPGNVEREVKRAADDIGREVGKGIRNVGTGAIRIGEQAKKDVGNGVKWVGDRVGIRW